MTFNPEASAFDDEARKHDTAFAVFEIDAVELTAQTEAQGTPVYEEREFVVIRHPGDRTYEQREVVRDDHKKRWPREYAAFKAGIEAPLVGTPIAEWPPINKAQVLTLQYLGVRTVENLAELPDDIAQKIGTGGMTLRSKAQAWLKSREDGRATMKATSENDALRKQLEAMQAQLAALSADKKPVRAKLAPAEAE